MKRAGALVPLLLACLSACGGRPRSEVVTVVDCDYSTDPKMLEVDTISIVVSGGGYVADPPGDGAWSFGALGHSALALPVSLDLWAGSDDGFTVDVTAAAGYLGTNLVQRGASGVRAIRGERRTLAFRSRANRVAPRPTDWAVPGIWRWRGRNPLGRSGAASSVSRRTLSPS